MNTKACSQCKIEKYISEFSRNKSAKDGLRWQCKKCHSENNKKYNENHKEEINRRTKLYNKKNKENIKENKKQYYQKNKDRIKKVRRIYIKNNKDKIKKSRQLYFQRNKEKILICSKKWYQKNREDRSKKNKIYFQSNKKKINKLRVDRIKNNLHLRLRHNVSTLMRHRLEKKLLNRNRRSKFSFLPYTLNELKEHLESNFKPGMSWSNYGFYGWHIDHIRPDSSFNYESVEDEEFQKCWALDNLQPLWAKENWSKNKY